MNDTPDPNEFYKGGLAVAHYDAFYEANLPHSPVAGDIDFYIARAREQGTRVLELAVGTGRVAIPMAEAGFAVTGIDISPEMLAVAQRKADALPVGAGSLRLIQGSMVDFALDEIFDLALIPFRSFQHVIDPAAQRRTLKNIHAHLRPGGLLVIDLFDADLLMAAPGAMPSAPREARDPRTGHLLRRTTLARDNDPFAQTIREHMRVQVFDESGALVTSEESAFTLRWCTHNEFACMLELSGFPEPQCLGDFQGGPPGYKREQIWLARKP